MTTFLSVLARFLHALPVIGRFVPAATSAPPPATRRPGARRTVRRLLAAGCLGVATVLVIDLFLPESADVPAVVTTRDVPAGQELTAADLEIRTFTPGTVPAGAPATVAEVAGATTAGVLGAGTPITPAALVSADAGAGSVPPGMLLMPLTVTDPALAQVVSTGRHLRIFARASSAGYTVQPPYPGDGTTEDEEDSEGSSGDADAGTHDAAAASPSGDTAAAGGATVLVPDTVVTSVTELGGGAMSTSTGTVLVVLVTEQEAATLSAYQATGFGFALLPTAEERAPD
ncbi:SAF domain-containing protein [Brevibacterium litoralis]|uniref:SAF domain-containing protein n=1 Tax=Brevibacterium litoralis TaxID=3138935 RepID=UPI0032EC1627